MTENASFTINANMSIPIETWLHNLATQYPKTKHPLLRQAVMLAQLTGAEKAALTGESCLQQGVHMVEILATLSVDQEILAAAILYPCARYTDLSEDDIAEQLSPVVAKLIKQVQKMDTLQTFSEKSNRLPSGNHIDKIRKMLLAIVDDIRIVLIKLAERLAILRHMFWLTETEKYHEAKITQDIYAPLANRLGIGQLKWELEDLSFQHLNPTKYEAIYAWVNSSYSEKGHYVKKVIAILKEETQKLDITVSNITGRAKHIYSIYRKMKRKNVDFSEIYDVMAFRLLVPSLEECYKVLGHVHSLWTPISKEFDDYIIKPKSNGYRSIHTAVIGPDNRAIEIQIRTFDMHQEAELGVAAHWIYKEGKSLQTSYEAKISWLRQVMEWQLEVTKSNKPAHLAYTQLFDDHIYVFTPQGEVIELIKDATPLDFAYHIHTDLGHRCRGAKVNGHIVPLTYCLQTGERVEIISSKEAHPSRDWLMSSLGYLKTSRAKSKVLHWFRMQNAEINLTQGQLLLEKEFKRLGLKEINLEKLAKKIHMGSIEELYTALGRGDIGLTTIVHAAQSLLEPALEPTLIPHSFAVASALTKKNKNSDINVLGVGNLLTYMAPCCKPIPGDAIVGYFTKGHGVSIHRNDCTNLFNMSTNQHQKMCLIEVSWGEKTEKQYKVDLIIDAYDRHGLIRDITQVLVSEQLSIIGLNCVANKKDHTAYITLSIEVYHLESISRILARIMHLPNVKEARRI